MKDHPSKHEPVEEQHRIVMTAVASMLSEAFEGYGFALLVFPFNGDKGRVNYISNAERPDMLAAMKEFIARAEGRMPAETETKQ